MLVGWSWFDWLSCDTPMDVANIRLATIVVVPLFIDLVLNCLYEIKIADIPSSPLIFSAMAQWMGLPPGR